MKCVFFFLEKNLYAISVFTDLGAKYSFRNQLEVIIIGANLSTIIKAERLFVQAINSPDVLLWSRLHEEIKCCILVFPIIQHVCVFVFKFCLQTPAPWCLLPYNPCLLVLQCSSSSLRVSLAEVELFTRWEQAAFSMIGLRALEGTARNKFSFDIVLTLTGGDVICWFPLSSRLFQLHHSLRCK